MEKERVIYILSYFRRIDEEIRFNETEIGEQEDIYYSTIAAQNQIGRASCRERVSAVV